MKATVAWPKRMTATAVVLLALIFGMTSEVSAQKGVPEASITIAVPNLAFAGIWVAEQLGFFEKEGVRVRITVASGASPCLSAVVGRSANFCASSSEGLILARIEGAPLIAVSAHNRTMTLSLTVRKEIVDKFKLSRDSSLDERLKLLPKLGIIGATSPGAPSQQIFKYFVKKIGADPEKLKFAFLGGQELPSALMNNVIDAFALSIPTGEATEAAGKGYVLIPLARGEIAELRDFPFSVLMARPDFVEKNPEVAAAVTRAVSRGCRLFHEDLQAAKATLRNHRFFNSQSLNDAVFELAFSMVKEAVPTWGNMTPEGWTKVVNFSVGAGILKDPAKAPSTAEGVLWTNTYVGKGP